MLFRVPQNGNPFSMGIGIDPSHHSYIATSKSDLDTLKWHYRPGHLNLRYLGTMQTHDLVIGLPPVQSIQPLCTACTFGKRHRNQFPIDQVTRATEPLALVHTDLCGPMKTSSIGGALYFLIFDDDFSRYTQYIFLATEISSPLLLYSM